VVKSRRHGRYRAVLRDEPDFELMDDEIADQCEADAGGDEREQKTFAALPSAPDQQQGCEHEYSRGISDPPGKRHHKKVIKIHLPRQRQAKASGCGACSSGQGGDRREQTDVSKGFGRQIGKVALDQETCDDEFQHRAQGNASGA
jgi:hypothetical protein